jgi:nitrogen regulatory protein PII-like uncharacterized protein
MTFSKLESRKLFITDNTEDPVCISCIVPEETIDKEENEQFEEEIEETVKEKDNTEVIEVNQ